MTEAAGAGSVSSRASPPPISRTLRFLVGAWLVAVVVANAPAAGGVTAATLAVTVLALVVFYIGLQLLLMRRPNLPRMLAVAIAIAPVVVLIAVGSGGMQLGAVTFYGVSLLVAAVRVPLNETCWLGINGVKPAYSGDAYRRAISDYVARLNGAGMVVILDLHWSAAGTAIALGQAPMPDRDHTPEFWREVATAFGGNDRVIFDLFNEPYPDNNADTPEAWRCWRDGGACSGVSFQAAGMQELVDTVRSTGATNVIMVGGVQYAASLSGWLAAKPTDPLDDIAASWHVYNFSACNTQACWNAEAAPVAQQVPLVLGELGENDRGGAFVTSLMDWMDARQGSYLAWSWDVWGQPLDLIASYDGTPTPYGQTFKTRYSR